MNFPLAHDENGLPLEVPSTAAGWLVRRHGGGKGRPAAVYDADGRPLIVALDATAEDLRNAGCRPGPHRLDAVDDRRHPMGAVAYTELPGTDLDEAQVGKAGADPAVMALARAVEAMQRVQAERERMQVERDRVQAEMFAKLIDRLAPPPVQPALELRNAVTQALDVHKALEDALGVTEEEAAPQPAASTPMSIFAAALTSFLDQMKPMIAAFAASKAAAMVAAPAAAPAAPPRNSAPEPAPAEVAKQKREAVLARLKPEERTLIESLLGDPAAMQELDTLLARSTVDEGVVGLRQLLGGQP
jgi:hypothetical protein